MGLLDSLLRGIGAPKRAIDRAGQYYGETALGIPHNRSMASYEDVDAPSLGMQAVDSIFPNDSSLGTAGSIGRGVVKNAIDLGTDPLSYAPMGNLSKLGRVGKTVHTGLNAALAGKGLENVIDRSTQLATSDKPITPEDLIDVGASATQTGLGMHGIAKGYAPVESLGIKPSEHLTQDNRSLEPTGEGIKRQAEAAQKARQDAEASIQERQASDEDKAPVEIGLREGEVDLGRGKISSTHVEGNDTITTIRDKYGRVLERRVTKGKEGGSEVKSSSPGLYNEVGS